MTIQSQIVLLLWLPLVWLLLISYKTRTAIIISYIGGLLFLPKSTGFKLPVLTPYTEDAATSYALILGILLLGSNGMISLKNLKEFRLKWIDIPMLMTIFSSALSAFSNSLGIHIALVETITTIVVFGVPYFLGRIYINNLNGLKELSISIIKGGILYVPLCLYEVKYGPFLHLNIYGYYAHESGIMQAFRAGGWRPMVFMQHGLIVAIWMVSVLVLIYWLWKSKTFKTIWRIPRIWLVVILTITFVLLRSTGAYTYFIYAIVILLFARYFKLNLPFWLLNFLIIAFVIARLTGNLSASNLGSITSSFYSGERTESFVFRAENEDKLMVKALERPIFGWSGWGRGRIYEENWEGDLVDTSVTDSYWIILLSTSGLFGLTAFYATVFLPIILFLLRYPTKTWFDPKIAPLAALSMVLTIFIWDTMYNSPTIAIFPLICGSLNSAITQNEVIKVSKKLAKKPLIQRSTY